MTPQLAIASRSGRSVARHGALLVFHPVAEDAHPVILPGVSMRWRGPDPASPPRLNAVYFSMVGRCRLMSW